MMSRLIRNLSLVSPASPVRGLPLDTYTDLMADKSLHDPPYWRGGDLRRPPRPRCLRNHEMTGFDWGSSQGKTRYRPAGSEISVRRMRKRHVYLAAGLIVVIGAALFLIGPRPETRPDNSELVARSGAETVQVNDPKHGRAFDVSVWQPEEPSARLVVISHGFDGDRTSHGDLAQRLVSDGFVVAAPTHPDRGGLEDGNPELDPLVLRPRHLQLTIDHIAQANPVPVDDVTVVGHSLGGYSALRLAGATPTEDELEAHCGNHRDDQILCSPSARSRISSLVAGPLTAPEPTVDRMVLLAPGYGPLFSDAELGDLQIPAMTVRANDDAELVGNQVERLQQTLADSVSVEVDGGHYVFLRTCTPAEQDDLPEICEDLDGVDRTAVQADLAPQLINFMNQQ